MSKAAASVFQPRKTPLQARSTATVDAILQAAVQVLLAEGKGRLTTTRIAARAGVSVGTLYQYFPNKSSLLQTLLKEHLDRVAAAVETACRSTLGASLDEMGEAIIAAFVQAKFRNIETSRALYAVRDEIDGKRIGREMHARAVSAMAALLRSARQTPVRDPETVAAMLLSAMTGVSRTMLEAGIRRDTMATMQVELTRLAQAYLQASVNPTALGDSTA